MIIWPTKVNLTFDTAPSGLTLYLDGIAKTTPFVYDTLVGFNHTIEARNQTGQRQRRTHSRRGRTAAPRHTRSWSPRATPTYTATYTLARRAGPITFVQVERRDTADQSDHGVRTFGAPDCRQPNVVVVGWNDTTSNVTSVTDSAGNTYQLAAPDDSAAASARRSTTRRTSRPSHRTP